jgi:hypothetical protein
MICKLVGRNGKGYDLKLNQLKWGGLYEKSYASHNGRSNELLLRQPQWEGYKVFFIRT